MQININTVSETHRDSNNRGPSVMFVLGKFDGGFFGTAAGKHIAVGGGEVIIFNGLQDHWSNPFSGGDRVSIVFFVHDHVDRLPRCDQDRLRKLGFSWSTTDEGQASEEVPLLAEPVVSRRHGKYSEDPIVRNFVHGCCEKGSLMTRPSPASTHTRFLEITKNHDIRTREAIDAAKSAITGPRDTFFWCSPCTGGSQRQMYNMYKAIQTNNSGTIYRIRGHRELHDQLKPAFFEIAEHAIAVGAKVILEWPDGCLYWDDGDYDKF